VAETFDAIVVGTGQAGPSLTARLNREGLKTALIERGSLGGTCVNVGCTPTKALVASARAAHMARRASDFGVQLEGSVGIDIRQVKERMRRIAGASSEGLETWVAGMEHVELVRGNACFTDAKTVHVDGRELTAERIFLNVGARPFIPPGFAEAGVRVMNSSDVIDLEELPEHLVIVGGSYIGLEFGQIYRRFGSAVTVIERGPRLIGRDDPDVSYAVREVLEAEGIVVHTDADCIGLAPHEEGVLARTKCDGDSHEVVGTHVLAAVGRTPNTDTLGLEAAGIHASSRGYIEVDDQLRTNVEGTWALGDCNGRGAFTHTSYNDYEIVAANLFDSDPRRVSDRILCYGLFIDPPLGRIGMTEAEARESGRSVLVGKHLMKHVGRAKERSETDGFIKILVDGDTEEILGAAILGIGGDEVVHGLLDVMYAKASYKTISRAVHIHPTVSELIPTTLQALRPL